jgi:cytochrome c oxidase subunit II
MIILRQVSVVLAMFLAYVLPANAAYQLNMTSGVTPISHAIYDLHMLSFWICVAIAVVVFGVMLYSLVKHRKSTGAKPATFHEHTTVEIIWAVIPFFILVAMAIPATKVLIMMDDTKNADVNIKITGSQWRWRYDYVDEGFGFLSNLSTTEQQIQGEVPKDEHYLLEVDKPLVVPINKKIRFLVTAGDVIHSWWVPALGVKRDAVPGFIHESWAVIEKPGTYRGQCAELCGKGHGFMPIVVEAKTQADYDQWLVDQRGARVAESAAAERAWTKQELLEKGEKTFLTYCSVCHQSTGLGMPPTFPALKGSPVASVPAAKSRHINTVLHGVQGTAMVAYGSQLSDVDLAAVITYERNAWGNNTGDVIQPKEIRQAREKE